MNTLDKLYAVNGENNTINQFKDALIQSFSDTLSGSSKGFKDAVGGIILSRDLTYVDPKILTKQYPDNILASTGISIDNSGGSAYNEVISTRTDRTGSFKTVKGNSADAGIISIFGDQSKIKSYTRTAMSSWTKKEVEQAQLGMYNLPNMILNAHNSQYQKELSDILVEGIEVNEGLITNTYFDSSSSTGTIDTLTADEVYHELSALVNDQQDDVSDTMAYKANTVIMPMSVYKFAQSEFRSNTTGDSLTVLTSLKKNLSDVKWLSSWQAETTANGGVVPVSVTVAFNSTEDSMVFRLPGQLEFTEIDHTLNNFQIASDYTVVGLDIRERKSGKILLGLAG